MRCFFTHAVLSWLLLCVGLLTRHQVSAQTIRYVKPDGSGLGFSWADASNDLQRMINLSSPGDQVWVKIGTYYPSRDITGSTTPADPRTRTFLVRSGVKVYGGFSGYETSLPERQQDYNTPCILSGDLNLATFTFDNAYHVVTFLGASSNTELNGFMIQDGNANSSTFLEKYGGGIICRTNSSGTASTPAIMNCRVQFNRAEVGGGGLSIDSQNIPRITSCQFESNTATFGGGVLNSNNGSVRYEDCDFLNNWATQNGGAVSNGQCSPFFTNCIFLGNRAGALGGGAVYNGADCLVTFRNCIFSSNRTSGPGGGINTYTNNNTTSVVLVNCNVVSNVASQGGGIAHLTLSTATGTAQLSLVSTIVWDNSADTGSGIHIENGVAPSIRFSDVQGCATTAGCPAGAGNVDTDPLFKPGFTLQNSSPLINAGDPAASSLSLYPIDLVGLPRVIGYRVDMGCYENQMTTAIYSLFSNLWDDPYTWSCFCVPTANDEVVLLHAVTIGYPAKARALRYAPTGRLIFSASTLQLGVGVRYVKPVATGTGDGTSWANASGNLQATLQAAQPGEEIWVQQGLYKPTTGTDRTTSFSITTGVKVYGGFVGTETSLHERNANLTFPLTTTLSGNIGAEASSDNSYCVVQFLNATAGTLLDGFVIQGAYTGSTTESPPAASGIQNRGTSGQSSSPTIQNCHVTNNLGGYTSGGLSNGGSGIVTLKNCLFDNNSGEHGGVIRGPVNASTYTSSFTVIITNCTFANNYGIYGKVAEGCFLKITNSIFWDNRGPTVSAVFDNYADGSRISYSTVQDGSGSGMYVAGTVSNADPRFVYPLPPTNYHLRIDSPAVNTGDPASTYAQTGFIDLEGQYRIFLGQIDQGCFEFRSTPYQYP